MSIPAQKGKKNTPKIEFECLSCGAKFPRWQGRCSECHEWNSLVTSAELDHEKHHHAMRLEEVCVDDTHYIPCKISNLDEVLGKGFARGSLTLFGGEPGIGKSTFSLQIAQQLSSQGLRVLYISAEETQYQLYLRSKRLGENSQTLWVMTESNMVLILKELQSQKPDIVILDSIQMVFHPDLSASDGSMVQVRYCAQELNQWVKKNHTVGIMIGHITKEGQLAGPKVLEHLVDVILYIEGERTQQYRLLRCYKNRYGSSFEMGIFEMTEKGLIGVQNPSMIFLDDTTLFNPGSCVSAVCEGSKALLVEVQALVVSTAYGNGKRNFVGINPNRAHLLIAVLEKKLNLPLNNKDIFLNIVGGLNVQETALDLSIALGIISSYQDKILPEKIGAIGEIGLTGEIRAVTQIEKRLKEFKKMGFKGCFVPEKNKLQIKQSFDLSLTYVKNVQDFLNDL